MSINEKAAYLKGLADGLNLDQTTAEGKLIAALIDMVDELSHAVSDTIEDVDYLNDYIEEIDEDLGEVEEILFEDDDVDYEDDDEEFECDGNCECCDEDCECDLDDGDFFEVVCPSCGETVCFDETADFETLACPACGEKFECLIDEEDVDSLKELD